MTHTAALWSSGGTQAETAASALATLCRNVLDRPTELRYRRVPAAGQAFRLRIAECPGALAVLKGCGFARQGYPDGDYYVLHHVDALLLRNVLHELEAGLDTIARLRAKRAGERSEPSRPSSDDARPAATDGLHLANDQKRQLAARAMVHRACVCDLACVACEERRMY